MQALLAFCHLDDIDCTRRPPTMKRSHLYRHFEGALGFWYFLLNNEIVSKVVEAVKFPPTGNRCPDRAVLNADFSVIQR